jgi:hypothetical protein
MFNKHVDFRPLWRFSCLGESLPVRRAGLMIFLCALLIVLALPRPVAAQQTPASASIVATSRASYQFGQVMVFSLLAESEAEIEEVTLFVRAPELPATLTVPVAVEPGRQVVTEYRLDLTQIRLPPFAAVTFWWRLSDSAGHTLTTAEEQIEYADDQFEWRQMERESGGGLYRVYWTGGDPAMGQVALDVIDEVTPRLRAIVPINWTGPLRIYIYPSANDLRASLRLTGRDWIGAHAHPELGVILVTVSNPRTAVVELRQSIPHELSHLLLYQATGAGYEAVPAWFDEGLATFFEPIPDPTYETVLREAVFNGQTIPFTDLCHTFPDREEQALLAYAQSASLIRMIQAEYGNHALNQIVRAFADGADCQSAVKRVLGISLIELNGRWLRSQQPQSGVEQFLRQNILWLLIVAAGFVMISLLFLRPPGVHYERSENL